MPTELAVQATVRIGSHHNNLAVTFDDPSALGQNGLWVRDVLDHMIQGDGIERLAFKRIGLQQTDASIQAATHGILDCNRVGVDAAD